MYVDIMCHLYATYFALEKHSLKICEIQGQNVNSTPGMGTVSHENSH